MFVVGSEDENATLVRDVFETLRSAGRPLVLILASDHGDEFLDHGGLGHGRRQLYQESWIEGTGNDVVRSESR